MNNSLLTSLLISTGLHFIMLNPASIVFHKNAVPEDKPDLEQKIEFEFFQAAPREKKDFFIPSLNRESAIPSLKEGANNLIKKHNESFTFPEFSTEELLEPSLEEQEEIVSKDEMISEILEDEVELEQLETVETVKWDYCNRIRSLIENQAKMPDSPVFYHIDDVVKVEITINREGKLIKDTPHIISEESSKYPEINDAAIRAVKNASRYFPAIPKRFPKDEITFWLPIRFRGDGGKKHL